MAGLSDLYQEILLEHNSKPRNFRPVYDCLLYTSDAADE